MISVDVLLECLFQYERFWALVAFERSFASVGHRVTLQYLFLDECAIADLTFERFLAGMYANVTRQCAVARERLPAMRAFQVAIGLLMLTHVTD